MYKQIKNPFNNQIDDTCVLRIADNACIPFDEANTDAIEFCKWLKAGGIPEAADNGTAPTQEEINAIIAKLS